MVAAEMTTKRAAALRRGRWPGERAPGRRRRRPRPRPRRGRMCRKGTDGISASVVTANFVVLTEGLFGHSPERGRCPVTGFQSRSGQAGFRRRATFLRMISYVASNAHVFQHFVIVCHISPHVVVCCHILPSCSRESSLG